MLYIGQIAIELMIHVYRHTDENTDYPSIKIIYLSHGIIVSELEEAFSIFDRDGDGSITKAELGEVLKGADVPFTPAQLDQFMEKLDKDGEQIAPKQTC